MWVREQCTDALFTEDRSKVAAIVYVPYMNSIACWGKRREKKKEKKKGKTQKLKTQQTWIQTMPKSQTFFFWPKNKRPLTLLKIFPDLLSFPLTSSDLVT